MDHPRETRALRAVASAQTIMGYPEIVRPISSSGQALSTK